MEKCPDIFYGSDFIDSAEINNTAEVLKSQSLFRYYGKNVLYKSDEFERRLCTYFNVEKSLVVSSGTAALKCALKAIGICNNDEVIVPAYGFIATAGAVSSVGATPVFADIEYSMNIDIEDIQKKITSKTKAIIVVHLFGKAANIEKITEWAHERGIYVIEDVAQAFGAEINGNKLGTIGDVGCLSFQQNKIITTGEGGAIISNNNEIIKRARMYHDQGGLRIGNTFPTWDSPECFLGENCRMGELTAAVGIEQIKKVDNILSILRERKRQIYNTLRKYNVSLSPVDGYECGSNTIIITNCMEQRDILMKHLIEKGVTVSKHYDATVYKCGLFGKVEGCNRAESLCRRIVGIPTPAAMSNADFARYLTWIDKAFSKCIETTNKVVKRMYKKGISEIRDINNLPYKIDCYDDKFVFCDIPVSIAEKNTLIVGGPCIDRCDGDFRHLTLDFYLDISMVINMALNLKKECAIYIDTPIEEYSSEADKKKWVLLANKIAILIKKIAQKCGLDIYLVRREETNDLLDRFIDEHGVVVDNAMYNMVPSGVECTQEEWLKKHYMRVVAEYHREFLNCYLEKSYDDILVVEGLSQCKAVNCAKQTDKSIIGAFYIDMPSVSGKNRMHRSDRGAITILDDLDKYIDEGAEVANYWKILELKSLYEKFNVSSFVELVKEWNKLW